MSRQGRLSIERMCDLAQVSRAGFYRSLRAYQPMEEAMEVRSAIQGIAVATGVGMATDASRRNCVGAACW
jgi:putative transposase